VGSNQGKPKRQNKMTLQTMISDTKSAGRDKDRESHNHETIIFHLLYITKIQSDLQSSASLRMELPRQRNRTHPNSISNKREKNHAKTVKDETKSPLTNIARI
jgi:hypothetical protein